MTFFSSSFFSNKLLYNYPFSIRFFVNINIFVYILFIPFAIHAQSITPHILNTGGGFSSSLEWSIGEGVSIAPFSSGGLVLNTGVLQPLSGIVTAINEYGPSVFGSQITIGPNPTSNILHIQARMNQIGSFSIQLIDAKSTIVYSHDEGTIFSSYFRDIQMQGYPDGVFYVRVYFKPINSIAKIGVYKIIKISN